MTDDREAEIATVRDTHAHLPFAHFMESRPRGYGKTATQEDIIEHFLATDTTDRCVVTMRADGRGECRRHEAAWPHTEEGSVTS